MSTIKPINPTTHSKTKINVNTNFKQSANQHLIPLVVHEYSAACQEFPIVFVKDNETGQFRSVALVGLKPEENLFVGSDHWLASYVPQVLTTYPFVVANGKEKDQVILCLDESADLVNTETGEALFDNENNQTPWCQNVAKRALTLIEQNQVTQTFMQYLISQQLLAPQTLTLNVLGEEYSLNGLYVINEQALNEATDEVTLEMKKRGYLLPIYSALLSMQRVQSLAKLKSEK